MKHSYRSRGLPDAAVFGVILALLSILGLRAAPAGIVPGRLLVRPHDGLNERVLQRLLSAHGARQSSALKSINVRVIKVPEARRARVLEALKRNPNIQFAEPDYLIAPDFDPNDSFYSLEWHLIKIGAPAAWDMTVGNTNVTIAILDSGIDATHPELAPLLVPGWNFIDNNANTADSSGHGTGVAGAAAAASNNGAGVAAVAWNCRLMPLRISDTNGNGVVSAMANALTYAADRGVRVANVSYRASGSLTLQQAAQYFQSKGGVVTVSAGNEGVFDASQDNPYVLTVSATDSADALASFSNTGNNVDLSAPGSGILTTMMGGGIGSGTGTSFAAPIVAGVAALMLSANPALSGAQIQDLLKQSADDLGASGWDTGFGSGRVNAALAIAAAIDAPPPGDTTAPTAAISQPSNGSTISGSITVTVTASDDQGVVRVELYLDSSLVETGATAAASFTWDTTLTPDGSHTLQVRAYDAAGNVGLSPIHTLAVANNASAPDVTPPAVQITSPTGGALTGKSVKVYVSSSDNVGVTKVQLFTDGKLYSTSLSSSPVFNWTTSKLARGPHTLQAVAYDAAGNSTRSSIVSVTK